MSKKKRSFGCNDLPGSTVKGTVTYEAFKSWDSMLNRVYSEKVHKKSPTYIGTDVDNEWMVLSNFAVTYFLDYEDGFQLDKDILIPGNKTYGRYACRFVPRYVNMVLVDRAASRGGLPIGVCSSENGYQANCNQLQANGRSKKKKLGRFKTAKLAHKAWQKGKITAIERVIEKYRNEPNPLPEIIDASNQRIQILKADIQAGVITIKL